MRGFLLEGVDGSGKTTLKDELIAEIKLLNPTMRIKYFHNGVYPSSDEALDAYLKQLEEAKNYDAVIWDRAHLSSYVYGAIFHADIPTHQKYQFVDARFAETTVLIHCKPPYMDAKANWMSRPHAELLDDKNHHRAVYDMFDYACQESVLKRISYDYTQINAGVVKAIAAIV